MSSARRSTQSSGRSPSAKGPCYSQVQGEGQIQAEGRRSARKARGCKIKAVRVVKKKSQRGDEVTRPGSDVNKERSGKSPEVPSQEKSKSLERERNDACLVVPFLYNINSDAVLISMNADPHHWRFGSGYVDARRGAWPRLGIATLTPTITTAADYARRSPPSGTAQNGWHPFFAMCGRSRARSWPVPSWSGP